MQLSTEPLTLLALLSALLIFVVKKFQDARSSNAPKTANSSEPSNAAPSHPELDIVPLPADTKLEDIPKLQLRPYRPVYYVRPRVLIVHETYLTLDP